jgi:folate-binding protein YgfZ
MTSPLSRIRLAQFGLISVTGPDATAFLQAQLTNSVAADRAVRAGWCTAKGRLIATLLVIPVDGGYLLQISADLAERVAKRLRMFVLRAKVKVEDVSGAWQQWGLAADEPGLASPADLLGVAGSEGTYIVRLDPDRLLLLNAAAIPAPDDSAREDDREAAAAWAMADIRSGQPMVTVATTELFIPQMLNLERLGAIDFKKGCYPGQEIVARTQYRGELKRRMVHAALAADVQPAPAAGQPVYTDALPGQEAGNVVNAVRVATGWEMLVVAPVPAAGQDNAVRIAPGGAVLSMKPDRTGV